MSDNDNKKERPDIRSQSYSAWSVPKAGLWSNGRPAPAKDVPAPESDDKDGEYIAPALRHDLI